ncbi:MAG TPA: ATP-dependent DNA ligase [Chloroflexia bacterium]|nr:ATP-dependent DNA ligase [Chloroflexia bacterium]
MPMPFSALAATLDELEPVTGRTQMIGILSNLLSQAAPDEIGKLVYLAQGRLLPDFIQEEFGMNERLIYRSVAQAYGVPHDEVVERSKEMGDAGRVAQHFAAKADQLVGDAVDERATVLEVYEHLISITKAVGSGSMEAKVSLLAALLKKLTPVEAKHVARIVVGRLRVGVGDPTLLDALSVAKAGDKSLRPVLERAYNLSSDLGLVASTLYGQGAEGLEQIHVRVGNPVRMALAERADTAEDIVARLGRCAVEPKYDGFRMQVHKNGDDVAIFSRGLENLSGMFPEVVDAVCRQVAPHRAIIEGEALAFDSTTGHFLPFQVTSQRRRVHNIEEMSAQLPLRLLAFDMLLSEDRDLTTEPYTERRDALVKAVEKADGQGGIQTSPCLITEDPEEIVAFYEDSLVEGFEGIVAKRLNGTYDAGKRGFNWIKMKRSYQSQLADTVDCVVVGYYYGKGHRASWGIGSLLVSVYDKSTDAFPTVTRVASGLSEAAWKELGRRLQQDRIDHHDPRVLSIIAPDIWVVPKYVFEVQADEVSRSKMHPAGRADGGPGYALRFPRILKERTDREPEDATAVDEVIKLHGMQGKGDTRGKRKPAAAADDE